MRFKAIFPLVFVALILWSESVLAQNGAEAAFQAGIAAFQKNDLKQARASFQEALKFSADNPRVLFNLGLVEQKSGMNGLALGLWRKALAIKPDFDPAQKAVSWTKTKLEHGEIPHEVEYYETLRSVALVHASLEKYLVLTALLLLLSGWLLLKYFGERRQAQLDEKPMPGFPVVAAICSAIFVVFTLLSAAKAYDETTVRGTVITKKIEARSAPDAGATPLFDLYEGLEVIVRQSTGEWTQVTYPGGSTGWIPKSSLLAITDKVAAQ